MDQATHGTSKISTLSGSHVQTLWENHRTLDFYMMSPVLADIVEGPIVNIQNHFRPHSQVDMLFKRVREIPWARVLCPVASGSPIAVIGPQQIHPQLWGILHDDFLSVNGKHSIPRLSSRRGDGQSLLILSGEWQCVLRRSAIRADMLQPRPSMLLLSSRLWTGADCVGAHIRSSSR